MEPVDVIEGNVSVLDRADVDTDQIIPKQFLKRVERTGFGEFLFYDWIRDGEIELEPNPILVAGRNFGCGSSPRARALGAAGLRLRGDHRALVRGHLLRQLHEDRAAAGDPRRGRLPRGRRGGGGADRRRRPDRRATPAAWCASRSTRRSSTGCATGSTTSALTLQRRGEIDAFEDARRRRPRPGDDEPLIAMASTIPRRSRAARQRGLGRGPRDRAHLVAPGARVALELYRDRDRPVRARRRPARPRARAAPAPRRAAPRAGRQLPGSPRHRRGGGVRPATASSTRLVDGPDQGRDPPRARRLARRVRGAGDVDDIQVRAARPPLRRRQGRRALRPEPDLRTPSSSG